MNEPQQELNSQPDIQQTIPQEPVQEILPPPKHFGPKFWIISVLILVVAGAAYGGIWWWQRHRIIGPGLSPTANWQTYTNAEYGFEFKYPASFELNLSDPNQVTLLLKGVNNDSTFFYVLPKGFTDPGRISLFDKGVDTKNVQLDNKPAREYQGTQNSLTTKIFNFYSYPAAWTSKNEVGYQDNGGYKEYIPILDQILSTFKFIN